MLSIRERPLPVLWLLTFLAPYLLFSTTVVSHFHGSEVFAAHPISQCVAPDTSSLQEQAQTPHPLEESECIVCDWALGSGGQQLIATHSVAAVASPVEYSAVAGSPVVSSSRILGARAPPSSI